MRLHLTAKEPGPGGIRLRPVSLDLSYATAFEQRLPDAYERLLMDVIKGNPTLFMRRDEVEAAWRGSSRSSPGGQRRPTVRSATRPAPAAPPPPRRSSSATAEPGRSTTNEHPSHPPRRRRRHRADGRAQPRQPHGVPRAASAPPATAARPAAGWPAPTSPTASPPPTQPAKQALRGRTKPNVAIVSAYNDMLSAHQPFETYPRALKKAVIRGRRHRAVRRRRARDVRRHHPGPRRHGALAVQPRRDRDVDGDRAVARHVRRRADARRLRQDRARPADRRAVLRAPADRLRARRADGVRACRTARRREIRQLYAEGKVGREELLEAEAASYHSAGTCTFYGTANSNQLLMEVIGLHLPGSAFVNPGTPLREALTRAAGDAGHRADPAGRRVHPDRRDRRREGDRQRLRRAAGQPAARPTTRCTWSRSPAPPASR